jgi:large subunit ribosomal protein L28e
MAQGNVASAGTLLGYAFEGGNSQDPARQEQGGAICGGGDQVLVLEREVLTIFLPCADLQWLLLKGNNSFIQKRFGADRTFSSEKGNLRVSPTSPRSALPAHRLTWIAQNIHAFKYSGFANERTIHIAANASNHGIVLTSRKAGAAPRAIASAYESKTVKGKSGRKAAGHVVRQSGSVAGRLDLRVVSWHFRRVEGWIRRAHGSCRVDSCTTWEAPREGRRGRWRSMEETRSEGDLRYRCTAY